MNRLSASTTLSLTLVLLFCSSAGAQTTLRYKFKPGDQLQYELRQDMTMAMNVGGMNIDMQMNQTIDVSWNIRAVDQAGNAKMTQKFERVRFTMEGGPIGKIAYDSKDGKDPEGPFGQAMGPILKAMAGSEFEMTMTPRGEIKDVNVPEKITDALKNLQGAAGFGNMFTEERLKQMTGQAGLQLPVEAVAKGKTWSSTLAMKMPFGKMTVNNLMTYEGPASREGKNLERVTIKPTVTLEGDGAAAIDVKIKSQDTMGAAYFDNTAGRLVETNLTQNMEMEVSVAGQNFTQVIKQNTSLKLAK
jgi:hypothetical protein